LRDKSKNRTASRLAIKHFTDLLELFPDDLEVRWLLNLVHMTLGEYPNQVDLRFRLDLSRFLDSEFDIGKFRDVGHLVDVNRFNEAGGAIMEDFDTDGLLDLAVTSFDLTELLSFYRNKGDATFADRSREAGVTDQLGGLVCYHADYDNYAIMQTMTTTVFRTCSSTILPGPAACIATIATARLATVHRRWEFWNPIAALHAGHLITTTTVGSTFTWAPAIRAWPL
jgi:hypothetical protein